MHEEALILHHDAIEAAMFQVALYITAFQLQLFVRNIFVTVAYGVFFMWWISSTSISIGAGGLMGLGAALVTTYFFRAKPFRLSVYGPYYALIQPLVIYYTITLFIPQTSYPLGYPIAFLLWFLGSAVIMHTGPYKRDQKTFFSLSAVSVCFTFFAGFWAYEILFVAVGVGTAVQLFMVLKPVSWFNTISL